MQIPAPRPSDRLPQTESDLETPLVSGQRTPTNGLTQRTQHAAQRVTDSLQPLLRAWPWVAGTVGSGVLQASMAVSARPDVKVAELATCGTGMALGTWLYGEGVRPVFRRALEAEVPACLEAGVAAAAYLGVALGVILASRGQGPVQMLGIGVTAVASEGFNHTLALALGRRQGQDGAPSTLRAGRGAVVALAVAAVLGALLASVLSARLSAAYAAGTALFCQAMLRTAWASVRQT